METVKFFASLGIVAGYGHDNIMKTTKTPEEITGEVWQKKAAEVMAETKSEKNPNGVYVGAVIARAKTVYHTDWGCPVGGEDTVLLTGEANPKFTAIGPYGLDFREAVRKVLSRTAQALGQTTTQLTFLDAEFEYFEFQPEEKAK